MAKIPTNSRMKITYPTGDAYITLRRPTNEEQNRFEADRFNVPDKATPAEALEYSRRGICTFFDKLVISIENLEDEEGDVTLDRLDAIPQDHKVEIMFRRWTPTAVEEKN